MVSLPITGEGRGEGLLLFCCRSFCLFSCFLSNLFFFSLYALYRGVKNSVLAKVNELEKNGAEPSEIVRAVSGKKLLQALTEGNTEGAAFLFGQSIGRIHEIKSCADIIRDTVKEAEETLRAKAALFTED